ncbi:hypothetical protein [Nocardioides piscis]|uniref:Uncharacterized protein n=1 Tax=Nocardioides piscis TaxID=2714938 RepID=A0A6G7YH37_9ACTN|nr:hypothetical protein [Nocardioides piscis]QIK76113.1 hypothetical protein G7071_12415 [Nocardioides piscis]
MTAVSIESRTVALSELIEAADWFAERARLQELRRDEARPGTGPHHLHAHSATIWRQAERQIRDRILALAGPGPSDDVGA